LNIRESANSEPVHVNRLKRQERFLYVVEGSFCLEHNVCFLRFMVTTIMKFMSVI